MFFRFKRPYGSISGCCRCTTEKSTPPQRGTQRACRHPSEEERLQKVFPANWCEAEFLFSVKMPLEERKKPKIKLSGRHAGGISRFSGSLQTVAAPLRSPHTRSRCACGRGGKTPEKSQTADISAGCTAAEGFQRSAGRQPPALAALSFRMLTAVSAVKPEIIRIIKSVFFRHPAKNATNVRIYKRLFNSVVIKLKHRI